MCVRACVPAHGCVRTRIRVELSLIVCFNYFNAAMQSHYLPIVKPHVYHRGWIVPLVLVESSPRLLMCAVAVVKPRRG